MTTQNKDNKYLITSALPYVNGDVHIGHLTGCLLPADVYARFCRARGRDVLSICGADEHGTASMVAAAKEGLPVLEFNNKYYEKHLNSVNKFNLAFDLYGRTHTELHKKLIHELFNRLDEQGLIEERETVQPYCITDGMFLADRQINGTCPKCGAPGARGDQCESCSATYEADELINPYSVISGATDIEMRPTKNLFFLASKLQDTWVEWLKSHAPHWSKSASSIALGWAKEGLRDTAITRDLTWGIPVNKPGYESKVFYVWFDAPWGYVSISQAARDNWADWWKNPDCHYAQFMGKDNVKFHAVFFPEQQLAMNDNWKTVDMLKGVNFLTMGGGKVSKSGKQRGLTLDEAVEIAPADAWKYFIMASAPETDDSPFTFERFADVVNKDLNGMLGNFVSRVCKLTAKNFGETVPAAGAWNSELASQINEQIEKLTASLDACEFRAAIVALRTLYAIGNEYMTKCEPWTLVKNGDTSGAGAVLNECFQLIDLYARVSAPFIPTAAEKMQNVFVNSHDLSWPSEYEHRIENGAGFVVPENLFNRIDSDMVAKLTAAYAPKTDDAPRPVIAKIVKCENHPTRDDLHVLTVNAGGDDVKIVCGAPNARAGLISVLAPVGAILPGFKKPLSQRTVAGVESFGMMCSAVELGVGTDGDNIIELGTDAKIGEVFKG